MNTLTRTLAATTALAAVLAATPDLAPDTMPRAASWDGVVRGDLSRALPGALPEVTDERSAHVVARAALASQAEALGVDADDFAFDHVTRSDLGWHVRGHEYRDGVAVDGTSVAVHVIRGQVWQVEARGSSLAGTAATSPVTGDVARDAALAHLGLAATGLGEHTFVAVDRRLTPMDGSLVDLWRVHVTSLEGVAGTVLVDAATGAVVGQQDDRRFADGTAQVFDPNPIVRLQDPSLRQPGLDFAGVDTDLPDDRLTEALTPVAVVGLDMSGLPQARLHGPWVDVRAAAPLGTGIEEAPDFAFDRADPRFEAVMAYVHIDRLQRYFQDVLGLTQVNAEDQLVIAIPVPGFDNSFYQPANDLMLLGSGGVDDGEDAEVILHEYGHAIHDAQVPGWGRDPEGGAMGEGFGDFLAAAYYAREISQGFQDTCLMDWDSTSYSDDDPTCIRRMDTDKHYPEDKANQVHADGEMWSKFLWNVRARLGATEVERSDRVLRLLLTSHTFLTPTADFADAVAALDTAAVALSMPDAVTIVREEAERIGFETP